MSYKLLTNLLFEPRGKHNPSLTYNIKDTVMSEDGSKVYFALDNVPAGIPLTDTNYWMLQIDLSASKAAMEAATANARTQTDTTIASANTRVEDMMGKAAEAVTSVADYATKVGMRVKGETKITNGNPMKIYPDGGSLLKVQTDIPIKQLGSGDPYPAGGGKNLCPSLNGVKTESGATFTPRADGSVSVSGTATVQAAVGTSQFILKAGTYTVSGAPIGSALASYDIYVFKVDGTGTIARSYDGINGTFTLSEDTNVALAMRVPAGTVDTSKVFWPMVEAGSAATAFMPYSNIRPFIGYDKLELNHVEKNLVNSAPSQSITTSGVAFSASSDGHGTVVKGTSTATYAQNPREYYDTLSLPPGTYTFSRHLVGSTNGANVYFMLLVNGKNDGAVGSESKTYTFAEQTEIGFFVYVAESGKTVDCTMYLQLEFGSDATPFAPYQGKHHTVQLDKTTYQGHYDWLTGKFRAEWMARSFDGTNDNWRVTQYNNLCAWVDVPELAWSSTLYSSHFKCYNSITGESDGTIGVAVEGASVVSFGLFFGIKGIASTVDEWKAYLAAQNAAGTPVQVAYKLATPIEIQLAPNVITAVEDGGVNHIYGDADLTVEWVKPLETSLIEHSNAKVDANNEALLMDVAQKERSVGNPIVINDAVANVAFPRVETEFAPKQAGSGDPYPAGGGKNLCNGALIQGTRGTTGVLSVGTAFIAVSIEELVPVASGMKVYVTTSIGAFRNVYRYYVYDANKQLIITEGGIAQTASVTMPDGAAYFAFQYSGQDYADFIGAQVMVADGEFSEYAPYSNIRPLSGYDKLNLGAAGKNLFNLNQTYDYFVDSIITGDVITTTFSSDGSPLIKEGDIHPAGAYTLTIVPVSGFEGFTGWLYYADNDEEKKISPFNASKLTATIVADRPFKIGFGGIYRHPEHTCSYKVQLEVGSDSTAYAPYQGTLHTVQIGETVYGGRYNWLTGKLVAEWINITFVGGEVVSTDSEGSGIFTTNAFATAFEAYCDNCCSHYASTRDYETLMAKDMSIAIWGSGQIRIHDSRFKSIAEINSYYKSEKAAGTPVQVAYKLSTPIEIQLDPTRITTIPGTNTIFGDGEFTIDWFKSYKKVAEERENILLDSFTDKAELSGNPIVMTPVGGISFDSVVTEFAPKQSGSGDPYPAGGGRNLLNNTATTQTVNGVTFTVNADGTVTVDGTATANAVFRIPCNLSVGETYTLSGCPAGGSTSTYFMQIGNFGNDTGSGVTATATENTGSSVALLVMSGYTASNIVFKPQLELGSTATEFQPYSNIRPITGYDKLDLNHAGKNLMPVLSASDSNSQGVEWKNNKDGSWTANGTAIYASYITGGGMAFALGVLPAGEYKLNVVASSEETGKLYLRIGSGAGAVFLTSNDSQNKDKECTFVADGVTEYYVAIAIKSGETVKDYRIFPVLVDSSHSVYSINIGQTVYGGKLDWLTGKLMAEWKFITLTADNIARSHSNYQKTCDIFVAGYSAIKTDNGHVGEVISSHCKTTTANEQYVSNNNFVAINDKGYIVVTFKDILTDKNAKTYVTEQANAGTPVQIAYKLATPIEIQLTPSEIIALTGTNTLYGDGNTITAKFRQSKDVDILKRLSALETLMTNQTKGE